MGEGITATDRPAVFRSANPIFELGELYRSGSYDCDLELNYPSIGTINFGRFHGQKIIL